MRIAITGTPGTGKRTVSKLLAKSLGIRLLNLNTAIAKHELYLGYDRVRASYIADMPRLRAFVQRRTRAGRWLITGHLAHLLPPRLLDIVIVLRCEPVVLAQRLRRRAWSKAKIAENLEAELIGLIAAEARQRHANVHEIDTTRQPAARIARVIEKIIKAASEK